MRTISSSIGSSSTMQAAEASTLPPSPTGAMTQRSPWHSPVPYLFGGLAAMLGLIAFALLILACSYWRLSGQMDERDRQGGDDDRDEMDLESGAGAGEKDSGKGVVKVYEEKILVIMAGDDKPTFLATPVCAKVSSFGERTEKTEGESNEEEKDNSEKVKEVMMMMISDHHDHDLDGANNSEEEARENQLEARDDQNQ
ncbi:hypothetical protein TorRG33x02_096080 [Trema orientale]|uniref:Protein GLUTAMINE DUMPER n=1 Tax=Trema orientale TaxID=63057 RepID=A0A2P5F9W5_TREOI|nr:hypothetical protein TorRG33x02_096080 [Trema orientale]